MKEPRHRTAGEIANQALSDNTVYDALEVGYALTEDIAKELQACVEKHDPIFDMPEYCVVILIGGDPLIKNLMRRKFYAWPYMPQPRPNQTVFLYNKAKQQFVKRLWVLPNAMAMETLYETHSVVPRYKSMKAWSHAFYDGCFWTYIRKEHGIDMLSEKEYLNANRKELIKAGCKEPDAHFPDPFDFSKIHAYKVINSDNSII